MLATHLTCPVPTCRSHLLKVARVCMGARFISIRAHAHAFLFCRCPDPAERDVFIPRISRVTHAAESVEQKNKFREKNADPFTAPTGWAQSALSLPTGDPPYLQPGGAPACIRLASHCCRGHRLHMGRGATQHCSS